MKFSTFDGLPFIDVHLTINQQVIVVDNVLLDTGSAASLFSVDFIPYHYASLRKISDKNTGNHGEKFETGLG